MSGFSIVRGKSVGDRFVRDKAIQPPPHYRCAGESLRWSEPHPRDRAPRDRAPRDRGMWQTQTSLYLLIACSLRQRQR